MLLAAEQAAQSLVAQLRRPRRDLTVMKAMSGGWSTAALARADLPLEQVMRGWVLTCGRSEVMRGTTASAQLKAAGSERSASDSSNGACILLFPSFFSSHFLDLLAIPICCLGDFRFKSQSVMFDCDLEWQLVKPSTPHVHIRAMTGWVSSTHQLNQDNEKIIRVRVYE